MGTVPVSGCAAGESAPVAAAAADLPFEVQVTSMYVAVTNRSGRPLTNIRVTIIPAGLLRFTSSYSRIESRGRRIFNISDFRARDSSPLSLRIVKPQSVLVELTDGGGKELQAQVPWKP
jgi:hypothetical protein